ncbi:hypothetical protein [Ferroacidibacillus organovorans]|uniref:Uncharacterized protein n=1 Tax=Ferroacidibacillus organovorans TaxID=1765683 RepID=A0A162T551_9BACL|nr:hypothetical protein [Ferroacidibacillus organovorans]KYP80472.1 hypothetical protein AYJ22_02160 [Ferroacidibacillus organovorans]OAG94701.1 hypothetical protein AYW79_03930 [Ferroacidibacillus organovorans]OPG16583.1 hypothetical protein B2M26_06900 [Ferroacidibacillus organovorans]
MTLRMERVSRIVGAWNDQLQLLEGSAVEHFRAQDLEKIGRLVEEKRTLERRIERVQAFIEAWRSE